jgi:hypothetical protein
MSIVKILYLLNRLADRVVWVMVRKLESCPCFWCSTPEQISLGTVPLPLFPYCCCLSSELQYSLPRFQGKMDVTFGKCNCHSFTLCLPYAKLASYSTGLMQVSNDTKLIMADGANTFRQGCVWWCLRVLNPSSWGIPSTCTSTLSTIASSEPRATTSTVECHHGKVSSNQWAPGRTIVASSTISRVLLLWLLGNTTSGLLRWQIRLKLTIGFEWLSQSLDCFAVPSFGRHYLQHSSFMGLQVCGGTLALPHYLRIIRFHGMNFAQPSVLIIYPWVHSAASWRSIRTLSKGTIQYMTTPDCSTHWLNMAHSLMGFRLGTHIRLPKHKVP